MFRGKHKSQKPLYLFDSDIRAKLLRYQEINQSINFASRRFQRLTSSRRYEIGRLKLYEYPK